MSRESTHRDTIRGTLRTWPRRAACAPSCWTTGPSADPGAGVPELDISAWYALTRVTAWSSSRLTIRLPIAAEEVRGWDRATLEEIERLTRQRATRAASPAGDPVGAPENTVISVNLIRGPGETPL